ncbi:MAG: protein kinase [Myxococcales bacterium]|nr:protein kinase [Myxococcales bacterium]
MDDEARLQPGTMVADRYQVEALIGVGGLAEVYRVRHTELGSSHALKLLTWHQRSLTERLLLEGRIQAQLSHPNIVRVTDVVRHDGHVALLMELISGHSLEDLLQDSGALPLDDALSLFAPILAAVCHAHESGVLHRDLKPANVLLAREPGGWVPKVTDFGLAKVVEEGAGTRTGMSMGTPGYMAPEQVRDSASVDAGTDIFALGCILYEMLAGRRAYEPKEDSSGHVEITATIERTPPDLAELVPDLSDTIGDAVARAMDRDRDARFDDCRSFAHALGVADHPSLSALPGATAIPMALTFATAPTPPSSKTFSDEPVASSSPRRGVSGALVIGMLLAAVAGSLVLTSVLMWPVLTRMAAESGEEEAPPMAAAAIPSSVTEGTAPEPEEVPVAPAPSGRAEAPEPPPGAIARPTPAEEDGPAAGTAEGDDASTEGTEDGVTLEDAAEEPTMEEGGEEEAPEEGGTADAGDAGPAEGVPPAPAGDGMAEATAPPEPVEQPAATRPIDLPVGRWTGTASGRAFELRVDNAANGALQADAVWVTGANTRREALAGTIDADGNVRLTALSSSKLQFVGRYDGSRLEGTYSQGGRRSLAWSVSPP